MMSGRGLGHSGGTLDKLESIPGFRVQYTLDEFREVLSTTGAAMIGATKDITPADRRMYALRDVTGTVGPFRLFLLCLRQSHACDSISPTDYVKHHE